MFNFEKKYISVEVNKKSKTKSIITESLYKYLLKCAHTTPL